MLKVYILVVVIGLVGGVCYGGYYYYKDTQERIQTLTENNAKIMVAKQQQDQTINTLIADREKFETLNNELQTKLSKANQYKDTLIAKLRKHNLAKLSFCEYSECVGNRFTATHLPKAMPICSWAN